MQESVKGKKTALIVGAGPAGLTAAQELVDRSNIAPLILEASDAVGGICRTVCYKGNRIDIGGHRFFSKSDRVLEWWLKFMPLEHSDHASEYIHYHNRSHCLRLSSNGADPYHRDRVMLLRNRKSRIYFAHRFFDYPLQLSPSTLLRLGPWRAACIAGSYVWSVLHRKTPEANLEQFIINRFGRELYLTFFKSYTEKVWGVPCSEISAEWGAQRIKGLSLKKTILHFFRRSKETSLIEKFLYPKFGPGQLWECVADSLCALGVNIYTGWRVTRILSDGYRVQGVEAVHASAERRCFTGDFILSTMPVQGLIHALDSSVPQAVREIANGLQYRDFIIAGVLLDRLRLDQPLDDNWIYIQEPGILAGRLQIFNNWSPWMVADPSKMWIGVEYFCSEGDAMWSRSDAQIAALAVEELERMGIASRSDVRDSTVIRMLKTYPAYFGLYSRFEELRTYLDRFENLFLIGRNGMHKYNNQDHSMLTAMTAVDNILAGVSDKSNIWGVNTEMEYGEEKG